MKDADVLNAFQDTLDTDPDRILRPQKLLAMQIIAGSMPAGVSVLLAFALYLVLVQGMGQGPRAGPPMLTYVALAMMAVGVVVSFAVPHMQMRAALGPLRAELEAVSSDSDQLPVDYLGSKLMALRQTTLIVSLAPLEGAAYHGCIAYMMEAEPLALSAVGIRIALMFFSFPTRARVRAWLERQARALAEQAVTEH